MVTYEMVSPGATQTVRFSTKIAKLRKKILIKVDRFDLARIFSPLVALIVRGFLLVLMWGFWQC